MFRSRAVARVLFAIVGLLFSAAGAAAAPDPAATAGNTAWILTATTLVLFMTLPGLALFYAGLVQVRNVLSVLMHCFAICCLVSILWMVAGYSLAFGDSHGWIGGLGKAFLGGLGTHAASGLPENVFVIFQMAFAVGAAFSGLSGAIFASKLGTIYPHSFNLLISINALSLIIVGGMGSIPGVIVGALALVGLPELLREFDEFRLLVYGAVLMAMMLYRPEGLWPEKTRQRELHAEEDTPTDEPVVELAGVRSSAVTSGK